MKGNGNSGNAGDKAEGDNPQDYLELEVPGFYVEEKVPVGAPEANGPKVEKTNEEQNIDFLAGVFEDKENSLTPLTGASAPIADETKVEATEVTNPYDIKIEEKDGIDWFYNTPIEGIKGEVPEIGATISPEYGIRFDGNRVYTESKDSEVIDWVVAEAPYTEEEEEESTEFITQYKPKPKGFREKIKKKIADYKERKHNKAPKIFKDGIYFINEEDGHITLEKGELSKDKDTKVWTYTKKTAPEPDTDTPEPEASPSTPTGGSRRSRIPGLKKYTLPDGVKKYGLPLAGLGLATGAVIYHIMTTGDTSTVDTVTPMIPYDMNATDWAETGVLDNTKASIAALLEQAGDMFYNGHVGYTGNSTSTSNLTETNIPGKNAIELNFTGTDLNYEGKHEFIQKGHDILGRYFNGLKDTIASHNVSVTTSGNESTTTSVIDNSSYGKGITDVVFETGAGPFNYTEDTSYIQGTNLFDKIKHAFGL